ANTARPASKMETGHSSQVRLRGRSSKGVRTAADDPLGGGRGSEEPTRGRGRLAGVWTPGGGSGVGRSLVPPAPQVPSTSAARGGGAGSAAHSGTSSLRTSAMAGRCVGSLSNIRSRNSSIRSGTADQNRRGGGGGS